MANRDAEPVILELAPLPREKTGPFLLLGVEKDADKELIEASWARRVIGARKNQISVPLENVNWAREIINDPLRRVRADVTSLNIDTADRAVSRLEKRYSASAPNGQSWPVRDVEKSLADYTPAVEVPDAESVRSAIVLPEVPEDVPALARLLEGWAQQPLNPWGIQFPPDAAGEGQQP